MSTDDDNNDDADNDEPSDSWKLLRHFAHEMTWPTMIAVGLVAAFFFFGVTNSLIKLSGHDIAEVDLPLGPIIGAGCGLLVIIFGAALKLSRHD